MSKKVKDENGNVTHKVCSKCGELKGIDEFNVDKRASDGHQSQCKECEKKYKEEHKKQIKEYKKKYNKEHEEQIKEYKKKYYEEHKEQIKEYDKKRWEEHKEQMNERNKKYKKEHKEQIKEYKKKYNEEHEEQIKEYNKEYKKKYWEELCDEAITKTKTIIEQDPTKYDYKVGEEIYGVVYLVRCKPTNKYYVGQTTIGFDNRYRNGFFNDKRHRTKDDLKEDYKKYGEDSFEITEIFKVAHSKEELDDLEVYYIDYFNSYYDGYNETRGNHHVK